MAGMLDGSTRGRRDRPVTARRHRLSRPQLGVLGRRVVAMGTGTERGSVVRSTVGCLLRARPPIPTAFRASSAVLGPDGPIGYATNVRITEENDRTGRPQRIAITARGPSLDLKAEFDVATVVTTRSQQGPLANQIDFLQLRGAYTVTGTAGTRQLQFTAPGAAETFRGR